METLITGASGNLGREISRALAGRENLTFVNRREVDFLPDGHQYTVDMAHPEELESIIAHEKPDTIIHLAAMIGGACEQDPAAAEAINVEATRHIGQLAAKYKVAHMVFASTAAVYNQHELSPTAENNNIDPQSVYGQTKLRAEEALREIAQDSSTAFTIFRIFNIYGPTFAGSLVHRLIHSTQDKPVQVNNPETFYRDYIHMRDVVAAFTAPALNNATGFNVYNIASGRSISTSQLIDELKSQGVNPYYHVGEGVPTFSWADIAKAKAELDFSVRSNIIVD